MADTDTPQQMDKADLAEQYKRYKEHRLNHVIQSYIDGSSLEACTADAHEKLAGLVFRLDKSDCQFESLFKYDINAVR